MPRGEAACRRGGGEVRGGPGPEGKSHGHVRALPDEGEEHDGEGPWEQGEW